MKTTDHFDALLPSNQHWFTPKEAGWIIGRTDQYVRDCFDSGRILGHLLSGRTPQGKEKRKSYQVHRDALILFLLETANYHPEDFVERVADLIQKRCPKNIDRVIEKLNSRSR